MQKPDVEKSIYFKQELTTFNEETGEIGSRSITTKRRIKREPEFIKLYLDDIMLLSELPKSKSDVLYLLLKKMNYDNEITIVARHKKDIADTLECSVVNIDKTLAMLVDKKILIRKDRGIYVASPYLFGRGSWESIEELRLSIDYKKDGKRLGATVMKEIETEIRKIDE